MYYENFDITSVVTPVNVDSLEDLLKQSHYSHTESQFILEGFRYGFDIGYRGPTNIKRNAPNLKFRIGSKEILWNKIMKEVKAKRYAGPFKRIPYEFYMQSPVGLVPKDGGKDTRLIFHLSYPRTDGTSLNACTPKELCSVKYADFGDAIRLCALAGQNCAIGKSDMKSAFRNLGIKPDQFYLLVLKAESPIDGKTYYFIDKCLPFGGSISCSHFQRVSNCIAHIVRWRNNGMSNINYLDDYFFVALLKSVCDWQIRNFLQVCEEINFPVSLDKTFWGTHILVFLGLLIDTIRQVVCIPMEKVERAKILIEDMLKSKKTTVHKMQKLTGFLNFLCRCIVPGRAFTRRLYTFYSPKMKLHHHINMKKEIKDDLRIWMKFLNDATVVYCRPFIDYSSILQAEELDWYTDASGVIGFGGYHLNQWFNQLWEEEFLRKVDPSIQYKELYAVTVSILLWGEKYRNKRIKLFCDNDSVVKMINKTSSGCKNCMYLIRIIVSKSMEWNLRVFAKHVRTDKNYLADKLSRFQMREFWERIQEEDRVMDDSAQNIPVEIWPINKIWQY